MSMCLKVYCFQIFIIKISNLCSPTTFTIWNNYQILAIFQTFSCMTEFISLILQMQNIEAWAQALQCSSFPQGGKRGIYIIINRTFTNVIFYLSNLVNLINTLKISQLSVHIRCIIPLCTRHGHKDYDTFWRGLLVAYPCV